MGQKGKAEIERIREESMITEVHPRLQFFSHYPVENWSFICLQNIRSLPLHYKDILNDPIMMASDVICMTETSLKPDQWDGWSNFDDFHVFQKSRGDKLIGDVKDDRKSGGVAILLTKRLTSTCDDSVTDQEIEMVSIKNEDEDGQNMLTLIYRDHSMPKTEFLRKIKYVFRKHSHGNSIIMGDFNFNMKEDDSLKSIANEEGFFPIVDCGTTIHDSQLDQIFINFQTPVNWKIVSLQSYYSDHNLIVLCINKNSAIEPV